MAISPQTVESSNETAKKNLVTFDLLSDLENMVARRWGLVMQLSAEVQRAYARLGHDLPQVNGDESFQLPLASTFVIDREGTIRFASIHPDHTGRTDPGEVIALLQRLCKRE